MRRTDREVRNENKIHEIIGDCRCIRLGFNDNGQVYIVPMSFGYEKNNGKYTFFFHCAKAGRKIDCINKNPHVGFEMDTNYKLNDGSLACDYSARFRSIIGNGIAEFMESPSEKEYALTKIMEHYTGKSEWSYPKEMLDMTCIFKVTAEELSCKEHE